MQTNYFALRSRLSASRHAWAFTCVALLAACADGPEGEPLEPAVDAGTVLVEAGPAPSSSNTTSTQSTAREDSSAPAPSSGSSSTPDASSSSSSSSAPSASSGSDAGARPSSADAASGTPNQDEIGSLIDTLLGASGDGGTSGEWKLEPDSAPECPAEPPPIPIIGGACLGIYYFCGWKNPAGDVYTCTCDWVHWLCI